MSFSWLDNVCVVVFHLVAGHRDQYEIDFFRRYWFWVGPLFQQKHIFQAKYIDMSRLLRSVLRLRPTLRFAQALRPNAAHTLTSPRPAVQSSIPRRVVVAGISSVVAAASLFSAAAALTYGLLWWEPGVLVAAPAVALSLLLLSAMGWTLAAGVGR